MKYDEPEKGDRRHYSTHAFGAQFAEVRVDEEDEHVNDVGAKGIGEIGIVGAGAAIANAVFHATSRRIRDLPILPERLTDARP